MKRDKTVREIRRVRMPDDQPRIRQLRRLLWLMVGLMCVAGVVGTLISMA